MTAGFGMMFSAAYACPVLAKSPTAIANQNSSAPGKSLATRPHSGWLYVLDNREMGNESEVLLLDPSDGSVHGRFSSGYAPDAAIAPDGSRLYVGSTDTRNWQNRLSVLDTTGWRPFQTVDDPFRLYWQYDPVSSFMAMSPDGRRLYTLKRRMIRPGQDEHWVEVFDAIRGAFVPLKAPVPSCGAAMLLPSGANELQLVCGRTMYSLQFSDDGALLNTASLRMDSFLPAGQREADRLASVQQGGLDASGRMLTLVQRNFRVWQIDLGSRETRQVPPDPGLSDRWAVYQVGAVSLADNRMYVPSSPAGETSKTADQIVIMDMQSRKPVGKIAAGESFLNLALSRDGRYLYATAPWKQNIMVFDTKTFQKIREWRVGVSPALVLVAP